MPKINLSIRRLSLSFAVCLSVCLAKTSVECLAGVPKSAECNYARYFDSCAGNHEELPHWNPSRHIDKDGFLSDSYHRIASDEDNIQGIHHKSKMAVNRVRVRQVPGDGNCLFHSLVVCLHFAEKNSHYCYRDYHELRRDSYRLRTKAIKYLTSNRVLYLEGDDYWSARKLLKKAAESCNTTPKSYCEQIKQETYWGGGPEVVALSNALKRPIHIYELVRHGRKREFRLRRMAHFGSPRFDKKEALHILSADSRFPDITPGRQRPVGEHFLALFPEITASKRKRVRVLRGGRNILLPHKRKYLETFSISKQRKRIGNLLSTWVSSIL